jgi:multicomponent Na+:H+ antiporter subunit D
MFAVAVIVLSTLLNAGYFLPIVYAAFFRAEDAPAGNPGHEHGEAPVAIVIALVTTATLTVALFWLPGLALELAGQLIGRGP